METRIPLIPDSQWVRAGMLLVANDSGKGPNDNSTPGAGANKDTDQTNLNNRERLRVQDTYYKSFSPDYYKFNDTALGGCPAINMPPQFCHHTDPNLPRFINIWEGMNQDPIGLGLGQWYSENIDDYTTTIHMRFGIAQYNSLWGFFSNFYSSDDSRWVRTGRGNSIGGFIGKAIGWVMALRLWPIILTGTAFKFFTSTTSTKFMYLKPSMAVYWKYVNDYANSVGADMELTANAGTSWQKLAEDANKSGSDFSTIQSAANEAFSLKTAKGQEQVNLYNAFLPDIYQSSDGTEQLSGINIYATANRYQRLADAWNTKLKKINEESWWEMAPIDAVKRWISSGQAEADLNKQATGTYSTAEDFLVGYYNSAWGKTKQGTAADPNGDLVDRTQLSADEQAFRAANPNGAGTYFSEAGGTAPPASGTEEKGIFLQAYETVADLFSTNPTDMNSAEAFFNAERRDGSQWVSFKINGKDSISESFSNSVRDSDIGSAINSASTSARNIRVSAADGLIGGIPGVKQILGFIGDIASNVADSLKISGIAALAGNAFADIPKHYDTSTAQFNQMSFTLQLRAPYGNDLSRFQNEILPLIMILTGVLPRSTGNASYGPPFYLEWFCKGRGQSRLSIISSVEVTRATSNMGWTPSGKFHGIDVRVTLQDLSSIMHMNMSEVSGWTALNPAKWNKLIFPQDSVHNDYISTLACLGLSDQVYKTDRLKRNWHKNITKFSDWFDPAARVNAAWDALGPVAQVIGMFSRTDRR